MKTWANIETAVITWTPEKLARLRAAFATATAEGRETFRIDGNVLVVGYAKYLIQHLDNQFAKGGNK